MLRIAAAAAFAALVAGPAAPQPALSVAQVDAATEACLFGQEPAAETIAACAAVLEIARAAPDDVLSDASHRFWQSPETMERMAAVRRGIEFQKLERHEAALADYSRALAVFGLPQSLAQFDSLDMAALRGRIGANEALGRSGAAIADLTYLVGLNPDDASVFERRAQLRLREQDAAPLPGAVDLSISCDLSQGDVCAIRDAVAQLYGLPFETEALCRRHCDGETAQGGPAARLDPEAALPACVADCARLGL